MRCRFPGAAATGTDREIAGQVRLSPSRECRGLFMPGMNPVDVSSLAKRFRDAVQTVAHDAVDASYAHGVQDIRNEVRNFPTHHLTVSASFVPSHHRRGWTALRVRRC